MPRYPHYEDDDELWAPPSIYDGDVEEDERQQPSHVSSRVGLKRQIAATPTHANKLFDPADWLSAQRELSDELAATTYTFGRLTERLSDAPEGMLLRLSLYEASEATWWTGSRVPLDRLTLYHAMHLGSGDDDASLSSAAWAVRRLLRTSQSKLALNDANLSEFLEASEDTVTELREVLFDADSLHRVTRAAIALHGWRVIAQERRFCDLEAAVLAACVGGVPGAFLPVALAGGAALKGQGGAVGKLAAFYKGVEHASLSALLSLRHISVWKADASAAIADLSGRTPPALLQLFEHWPVVNIQLAAELLNVSKSAVQRNLYDFEKRGLIRELTGQERYRAYTAALKT